MKSTFRRNLNYLVFILFLLGLLSCQTKSDHGFLRVDSNGRYFVFDDGTPFIPIGFNKFRLYLDEEPIIDSLIHLWSDNGVNYLRVWVGMGSEPEIQVGRFDEKRLARLDHIIEKCEEYGVYLSLCFWNDNILRTGWSYGWDSPHNKYNKMIDSLGVTYNPEDLKAAVHQPSFEAIKNRYKVFVKRWSHHKSIMMWDLVNDSKKTSAWKSQMYDYVRSIDPNKHIIGFQNNTGKSPAGEMDCGSVRVYDYNPAGNDPEVMAKTLFDRILEALQHGDPVYCGEGRMHYAQSTKYELERFYLHSLWGPLAVGAAGNLHAWVSESKSIPDRWPDLNLQELKWMKGFSEFCRTIKWTSFNSKNMNNQVLSENNDIKAYACGDDREMLIYLLHDDPKYEFNPVRTYLTFENDAMKPPKKLIWIDTRTGKVVHTDNVDSFPARVKVPPFRDGIFAHLK